MTVTAGPMNKHRPTSAAEPAGPTAGPLTGSRAWRGVIEEYRDRLPVSGLHPR